MQTKDHGAAIVRLSDGAHGVEVSIPASTGNLAYEMKVHRRNNLHFPCADVSAFARQPTPPPARERHHASPRTGGKLSELSGAGLTPCLRMRAARGRGESIGEPLAGQSPSHQTRLRQVTQLPERPYHAAADQFYNTFTRALDIAEKQPYNCLIL